VALTMNSDKRMGVAVAAQSVRRLNVKSLSPGKLP
jgi:hypothetical protein